jgi:perosamine synthetase
MTNIQAAIGLAQLERIDWFIERRLEVAYWYSTRLAGIDLVLPAQAAWAKNIYWLYSVVLPKGVNRDLLMQQLDAKGIETRPFFHPMHRLPPYYDAEGDAHFPTTTSVAARGINLPTSASLTKDEVAYVADALKIAIDDQLKMKVAP